jgi:aryl-alcohol dehydrogenase-like predicted oxidoreductase
MEAYEAFCAERGVTMLAATLAWFLAQPGLSSVISGATKPEQIRQNADAAFGVDLTPDDIALISQIFA